MKNQPQSKQRNWVAKHGRRFNRAEVMRDRTQYLRRQVVACETRMSAPKMRLDFDSREGHHVPQDMEEAIDRYVFDGLEPGGFVVSLLAHDLAGAIGRAHPLIQDHFPGIACWVLLYAPASCQGSYDAVRDWIRDQDQRRTLWIQQYDRECMWRRLQQA